MRLLARSRLVRRPARRAMVAAAGAYPGLGGHIRRHRPGIAISPAPASTFRSALIALAGAVLLAAGYLSFDVMGDVMRYRVSAEQQAVDLLDEQLSSLRAEIDEQRRLLPLRGTTNLDLLIDQ